MRKHIDYFYKCYDRMYKNEFERVSNECFNDYGYNFDSNKRREIDPDESARKTNYNECISKLKDKGK